MTDVLWPGNGIWLTIFVIRTGKVPDSGLSDGIRGLLRLVVRDGVRRTEISGWIPPFAVRRGSQSESG